MLLIPSAKIKSVAAGYAENLNHPAVREKAFIDGAQWAAVKIMSREYETIAYFLYERLKSDPLRELLRVDFQARAFWPEWVEPSMLIFERAIAAGLNGTERQYNEVVAEHISALMVFLHEKSK